MGTLSSAAEPQLEGKTALICLAINVYLLPGGGTVLAGKLAKEENKCLIVGIL